jgi:hypothetical protein
LPSLARAGLKRVFAASGSLPPDAQRAARTFASSPRELRADRVEFAQLPTVFRQTKALKSLDGKPLYILTADLGNQPGWLSAQRKLARLSDNSLHRTATGATHMALLDDKEFAVVTSRAIGDVVTAARTEAALAG